MALMMPSQDEDWEAYLEVAKQVKEPKMLRERFRTLIRVAPDGVLVTFIDFGGSRMASQRSTMGSIPLHDAIDEAASVSVVKKLIEAFPEGVNAHDSENQSPLDILCRRVIMSEEVQKYVQSSSYDYSMWEIARLMLTALSGQPSSDEKLLHALVKAGSDCPESLRTRAIREFSEQLTLPDANGDLPIHICAGITPDDEEVDDLSELIRRAPHTLYLRNSKNEIPLQIAIKTRTWATGIKKLVAAQPGTIESMQLKLSLYPLLISKLDHTALFEVLVMKPTIFVS